MILEGLFQWLVLELSSGGGDPSGVGIEEEEENHAESHEVHVDEEQDASVIETPAALHTTDGVGGAGDRGEGGQDEKRRGVVTWEVGEIDCDGEATQNEKIAA
jgi:hypothetical protein